VTRRAGAAAAHLVDGAVDRRQRLLHRQEQALPGRCQPQRARMAGEQRETDVLLQRCHLPTDRRLGELQFGGGQCERAMPGGGFEAAQRLQLDRALAARARGLRRTRALRHRRNSHAVGKVADHTCTNCMHQLRPFRLPASRREPVIRLTKQRAALRAEEQHMRGEWTAGTSRTVDLGYEQLLVLEGRPGMKVRVLYGNLWLTEEGTAQDVFAGSGAELALKARGRAVIEGLGEARVQVVDATPTIGHRLRGLVGALRLRQRLASIGGLISGHVARPEPATQRGCECTHTT
jgi:hypothetical protein